MTEKCSSRSKMEPHPKSKQCIHSLLLLCDFKWTSTHTSCCWLQPCSFYVLLSTPVISNGRVGMTGTLWPAGVRQPPPLLWWEPVTGCSIQDRSCDHQSSLSQTPQVRFRFRFRFRALLEPHSRNIKYYWVHHNLLMFEFRNPTTRNSQFSVSIQISDHKQILYRFMRGSKEKLESF